MEIKMTPLLDSIRLLDISDEEYFGSGYRNYISNSRLKLMNPEQGGSPELYKLGLGSTECSDSLYFGSAVHEMVLQPNDFAVAPITTRPTAKLGFMADVLYKSFAEKGEITDEDVINASNKIDYYKGKMTTDRIQFVKTSCIDYLNGRRDWESKMQGDSREFIYLDSKSFNKLDLCLASVKSNENIQKLLHPQGILETPISLNEATLLMDVIATVDGQEVKLQLKAKLDNLSIDLENNIITLNDLKTTGHILTDFGTGSFVRYHYARQMAMYLWMLKLYAQKTYSLEHSKMYANMMLVSTIPDYRSGLYRCHNQEIADGFREFKRLLRMVAYCEVYGYDGGLGANIDGSAFDL